MTRKDLASAFDVLELSPQATLRDVQNAYLRLKKLYTDQSIVLEPLVEEFTADKRRKILAEIEESYQKLVAALHAEPPKAAALFPEEGAGGGAGGGGEDNLERVAFGGVALRKIRERLNIDLGEISKELKLRVELLRNLEDERFEGLPEEIYLKGHLRNYAQYLGLKAERVLDDYLGRYRAWKKKK